MSKLECHDVRDLLLDYAEGELDAVERLAIGAHLKSCPVCQRELAELQDVRHALARDQVPDPGAALGEHFAEKVWQAYQAQHSANTRPDRPSAFGHFLERWRRMSLLFAIPAVAMLAVVVGSLLYLAMESPDTRSIGTTQAQIRSHEPLGVVAQRALPEIPAATGYGFSPAAERTGFFRVGREFSLSLAHASGGDSESARRHLVILVELLGDAAPPSARTLLRVSPTRAQVAALEPDLARLGADARERALFEAGGHMANLALAIAVADQAYLRDAVPWLRQLRRDLQQRQAPPGVLRDLEVLADGFGAGTLSDRELAQTRERVRNIERVLSE